MCWLLQVLEMLIAEDDTVPEVWYLLGLALHAGGEFDAALTAAGEAERLVSQRQHDDPNAGETLLDIDDLKVCISIHSTYGTIGRWAEQFIHVMGIGYSPWTFIFTLINTDNSSRKTWELFTPFLRPDGSLTHYSA